MNDKIEISPTVCHGQPVFKGTRITVSQVLGALAGGDSVETVLEDYPGLTLADLSAAMSFASGLARFEESPYEVALA